MRAFLYFVFSAGSFPAGIQRAAALQAPLRILAKIPADRISAPSIKAAPMPSVGSRVYTTVVHTTGWMM